MTRRRDDARRNMQGRFATLRADGTPVGSYVITYQDYCAEAFDAEGRCIAGSVGGPSHEPDSHTMNNAFMRGPYTVDYFDTEGFDTP